MLDFSRLFLGATFTATLLMAMPSAAQQTPGPATSEGDFVVHNFQFRSGESLPELRLHYTTLGKPIRDAEGRTTNAVLILHGTGGTGHQFFSRNLPAFYLARASSWMPRATTLFFPMASATESRRSPAMVCMHTSRSTTTTIWSLRTTGSSAKASA